MYPERHVESVGETLTSSNRAPVPGAERVLAWDGAGAVGLAQAAMERTSSADRMRREERDIEMLLEEGAPHLCAFGRSHHHVR